MGIKRYTAINDNTITNAFESNLVTRGTGSNMGLADSLEVFSIYAQATSASSELSRILAKFPVVTADATTTIQSDRAAGTIPASGSVDFYLRCYNVKHTATLPRNFTLVISPVSQSWEEGNGLDMEEYSDLTYGGTGSNWINAAASTTWSNIRWNNFDRWKLFECIFLTAHPPMIMMNLITDRHSAKKELAIWKLI